MKAKKLLIGLSIVGLVFATGCSKGGSSSSKDNTSIHVVTRENGSGTRDSFTEISGVLEKDANGDKTDKTTTDAVVQNSTDAVMSTVQNDKNAIGYISSGSMSDIVKGLKIDGVEPTKDNIKNKTYKLSRPFLIAYKKDKLSKGAEDFLKYLGSEQASTVIEKDGYIPLDKGAKYESTMPKGKLVISGSTSVTPLMEKLMEDYEAINPDLEIEIQSNGSSAGIADATSGVSDLAMSSRELKDEEKLDTITLGIDGIVVIVNNDSATTDVSLENLKKIYIGEIKDWSEVK